MSDEGDARIRLTKRVRQQLLDQNDGYTDRTYYQGSNFREQRDYEIRDGQLHIRSRGKTSWADSGFDDRSVADDLQTRRFLRNNLRALNTEGVETAAPRSVAAGRDRPPAQPQEASSESWAHALSHDDVEDYDGDSYEDPGLDRVYVMVGGALIAFLAVRAALPHAKRLWSESLAPRALRMRRRAARGEPSADLGEDGVGQTGDA